MVFEKLRDQGYTHVAVDFDGTLIDTSKVFSKAIAQASQTLGVDRKVIDDCVRGTKKEFNVNPVIVKVAVLIAARTLIIPDTDSKVEAALDRIDQIYATDIPNLFPGAIAVMDQLNQHFVTVMTTHALLNWTNHKKNKTGLSGKFAHTHCFRVERPKSEQWQDFFSQSQTPPRKWVIIGDDLQADLRIPGKLGSYTIHVPNGRTKIFSPETSDGGIRPSLQAANISDLLTL